MPGHELFEMIEEKDKIGREEARRRRALGKSVVRAVKVRAKGSGWKVTQGVLFREHKDWFVSAQAYVYQNERRTPIKLHIKPMYLDPIFWEIADLSSNVSKPLSFRLLGAWTCSTPALFEHELDEMDSNPDAIADQAITWANERLRDLNAWSVDRYSKMLQEHPRSQSYFAALVTTLILVGDNSAAAAICDDAFRRGDPSGFVILRPNGAQTFPELVLAWLDKRRRGAH